MRQPPVDYIQRTRDQYAALGYGAYRWVHNSEPPPFVIPKKPMSEWRVDNDWLLSQCVSALVRILTPETLDKQRRVVLVLRAVGGSYQIYSHTQWHARLVFNVCAALF